MNESITNPGEAVVDTNALIEHLTGDDDVDRLLSTFTQLHVPIIVLGELYHGVFASNRPEEKLDQIDEVRALAKPLSCDPATAEMYGRLKVRIRRKGRPIPDNDLWIAALAVRHGLTLVTRDAHFDAVEGLATIGW